MVGLTCWSANLAAQQRCPTNPSNDSRATVFVICHSLVPPDGFILYANRVYCLWLISVDAPRSFITGVIFVTQASSL